MKNFLKLMPFINWLLVSVIFNLNREQTGQMFMIFVFAMAIVFLISLLFYAVKYPNGMDFKKDDATITSYVVGNSVDIAFYSIIAHVIQNNLNFNIIELMVAINIIVAIVQINNSFTKVE